MLATALAISNVEQVTIPAATVQAVERSGCQSGIVRCWHKITIRTGAYATVDVHSPSMTGAEPLPTAGQTCRVSYHFLPVEKSVLVGVPDIKPWNELDDIVCSPYGHTDAIDG